MIRPLSGFTILLLVTSLVPGCTTSEPERSQMEIREIQTRTFRTGKTTNVMQAVTEALMDEGYVIKETNTELGIINGELQKSRNTPFYRGNDHHTYSITAQVRTRNEETRVRLNIQHTLETTETDYSFEDEETHRFKKKASNRITDPAVYRRLFNKIDKSLFIEKEVYESGEKTRKKNKSGENGDGGNGPENGE